MALGSTTTSTVATQSTQTNLISFLPMAVILVLFWFLLIRPQQRKAKEHAQMLTNLKKDDEVITNSGILGRIVSINDKFATLEINENNMNITVQKNAIASVVEKGTLSQAKTATSTTK